MLISQTLVSINKDMSCAAKWLHTQLCAVMVAVMALVNMSEASMAQVAPVDGMMNAMQFDELVEVLAAEGRSMSGDMEAELGLPKAAWDAMLGGLYQDERIYQAFRTELEQSLSNEMMQRIQEFYESDLGKSFSQAELDARKAISNDIIQDAAIEVWSNMAADAPRAVQIDAYVAANDLIELNIVSSMNSDVAYLRGFSEQARSGEMMREEDILRDVWASEPEVRSHVSEWTYGFAVLAYDGFEDEQFARYIDFALSDAGQGLNSALFAAFDAVYADISYGLGAGTAHLMQSQSSTAL